MPRTLPIGTAFGSAVPAHLIAPKLNRHTFWCGQSGSGKTYALGVLLEQVLLHTRLPLVVLDPNSDYVRLNEVRDGVPAEIAETLASRDVRVFRPGDPQHPLRVRLLGMPLATRATILGIDPIADAEEYNAMLHLEAQVTPEMRRGDGRLLEHLQTHDREVLRRLGMRLENLGVVDWDLWARGGRAVTDDLDEDPDATVVDLGSFSTQAEFRAAALGVLDHLWTNRAERRPRLIVIDEAHNLCSPEPLDAVHALLTERIVQIAAEGRKFGLWLLLSTQRPSKVHPNALSQCDNVALMRMSSTPDLKNLSSVFGFMPEELVAQSPQFVQGQALFAGGFIDQPGFVQMGDRLTPEGGIDVPVPLR